MTLSATAVAYPGVRQIVGGSIARNLIDGDLKVPIIISYR